MKLTELRIRLKDYGKDAGKYVGKAEFTNKDGDIAINLTAEMCDKMFIICSEAIVDVAKEAAQNWSSRVQPGAEKETRRPWHS